MRQPLLSMTRLKEKSVLCCSHHAHQGASPPPRKKYGFVHFRRQETMLPPPSHRRGLLSICRLGNSMIGRLQLPATLLSRGDCLVRRRTASSVCRSYNFASLGGEVRFGHHRLVSPVSSAAYTTTSTNTEERDDDDLTAPLVPTSKLRKFGLEWIKDANIYDAMTEKMTRQQSVPGWKLANQELADVDYVAISYTQTRRDGKWKQHTLFQETIGELNGVRHLYDYDIVKVKLLDADRWADYGLRAYLGGHVRIVPTLLSDQLEYMGMGVVTLGGRQIKIDKFMVELLKAKRDTLPPADRVLETSDIISIAAWMRAWPVAERYVAGACGTVSIGKVALEKLVKTLELLQEAVNLHTYWEQKTRPCDMPSKAVLQTILDYVTETSRITSLPPGLDEHWQERAVALGLLRPSRISRPHLVRCLLSDTFMNCENTVAWDKFKVGAAVVSMVTGIDKELARRVVGKGVRATQDVPLSTYAATQEKAAINLVGVATDGIRNIHYNGHWARTGDCFPVGYVPALALSITGSKLPTEATYKAFSDEKLRSAWGSFHPAAVFALIEECDGSESQCKLTTSPTTTEDLPKNPFAYKAMYCRAEHVVGRMVVVDMVVCTMVRQYADSVESHIRFYGDCDEPFLKQFDSVQMAGALRGTATKLLLRKPLTNKSANVAPSNLKAVIGESNSFLKQCTLGDIADDTAWIQRTHKLYQNNEEVPNDPNLWKPLNAGVVPFQHENSGKFVTDTVILMAI